MEEHRPAFSISHLPLGIIQTNCPIFCCQLIFIVAVPRCCFRGGSRNQPLVDEVGKNTETTETVLLLVNSNYFIYAKPLCHDIIVYM